MAFAKAPKPRRDGTALTRAGRGDLARYHPRKGLARVAVAEVAEKHYARAKDATRLYVAIREKLDAQAEFVFWWDTQAEKNRGAAQPRRIRSDTALTAGTNGIPDRLTISRWRKALNDPATFERTFLAACAKYLRVLELQPGAHVGQNSGDFEWYTPADYITAARTVLGTIDLDPASSREANKVVKATQFFTSADGALAREWVGRVWMNPPYAATLISAFCDKLAASFEAGSVREAIVLVNNATETQWFRTLADRAAAICFPTGRVPFWSLHRETATPLQGQAVLYLGATPATFLTVFRPFGILCDVR